MTHQIEKEYFSWLKTADHTIFNNLSLNQLGGKVKWGGKQLLIIKTSMTTYYCPLSTRGLIFDRNIMVNSHKYCNECLLSLKGGVFLNK